MPERVARGGDLLHAGAGASGAVVCRFGSLASGETAVLRITVQVITTKKTSITKTAISDVAGRTLDPHLANNRASISVVVK